jgi:hypothetical protein
VAFALGSVDAHFDGVVAEVAAEIQKNGSLFDLLAGTVFNYSSCLLGRVRARNCQK